MAQDSGRRSRQDADGDGETRVSPRPKRLDFDPTTFDAPRDEVTGSGRAENTDRRPPPAAPADAHMAPEETWPVGQTSEAQQTRVRPTPDFNTSRAAHAVTDGGDDDESRQDETRVGPLPELKPRAKSSEMETRVAHSPEADQETRVGPSPFAHTGLPTAPTAMKDDETRVAHTPSEPRSEFQRRAEEAAEAAEAQERAEREAQARAAAEDEERAEAEFEARERERVAAEQAAEAAASRPAPDDSHRDAPEPGYSGPDATPVVFVRPRVPAPEPPPDDESDSTRVGPMPSFTPSQAPQKAAQPTPQQTAAESVQAAAEQLRHERRNIRAVDLPADLRLPTFDFKASDSPDVAAAKAAGVQTALPDHLQLPTFPDLGPPPVAKQDISVPPPVPKKAAPPPLPALANPTPPLIDMSLPELAPRPTQRGLTLIGNAKKEKTGFNKRLVWPTVVAVVCAVVALGVFLARDKVVSSLAPKAKPVVAPPPSPQERAKNELAAGGLAYVAKDYQVAIHHFEAALTDDPRMVEAHRSLGIVYATLHDQAKAVRHYQDYLALSPHAADAAEVQKIVEDYKKAQLKAAQHESAAPPPESGAKHHKPGHGAGRRR